MSENCSLRPWNGLNLLSGNGCIEKIADLLPDLAFPGSRIRAAVFCGQNSARRLGTLERLVCQFPSKSLEVFEGVNPNPTISSCQDAANFLANVAPNTIIALGGGSVIDTAKVANISVGSRISVAELLRTPPDGSLLKRQAETFVAIPTTAGTGSEATSFATVWDFSEIRKYSLDTPLASPTGVLLDPSLTLGMPSSLTVSTALDALGHGLESIWSRRSSPLSSALAQQSVGLILNELPGLKVDPENLVSRERLLWASLLAGMAINLTRTAAAHALSYGLTLRFGVPHGLAVGALLPGVLKINVSTLEGTLEHSILRRCFGEVPSSQFGKKLECFLGSLGVNGLSEFGVKKRDFGALIQDSDVPGRMDNNCKNLSKAEIEQILEGIIQ